MKLNQNLVRVFWSIISAIVSFLCFFIFVWLSPKLNNLPYIGDAKSFVLVFGAALVFTPLLLQHLLKNSTCLTEKLRQLTKYYSTMEKNLIYLLVIGLVFQQLSDPSQTIITILAMVTTEIFLMVLCNIVFNLIYLWVCVKTKEDLQQYFNHYFFGK